VGVFDNCQLLPMESVPHPHTFRDPRIQKFMARNFEPDEPGSFAYQRAHKAAYDSGDERYLQFMWDCFHDWEDVVNINAAVVDTFRTSPQLEDISDAGVTDRHVLSWLTSPIEVSCNSAEPSLGDGQHRVTALRVFSGPGTVALCRVFNRGD